MWHKYTRVSLSAVVVARDEERQLTDCLTTLTFADEIVVVLDRCRDRSREIALGFSGRIVEGAWEREGPRRHAGIDACRGEWILEIDADERVPPELGAEIRRVIAASAASWHLIPVDNYIGTRLVRWGWGASFGRSAHAALYRKGSKQWGDQRVHPAVSLTGRQGVTLASAIVHYVDRDISEMLRRLDRYTSARAADLRESGDIGSYGQNLRRMASRFWKCYVGRRGYREGPWGFLIALCAALYPILSYLKARLEPQSPPEVALSARLRGEREGTRRARAGEGEVGTAAEVSPTSPRNGPQGRPSGGQPSPPPGAERENEWRGLSE
ncbi:MAG: glycosyltransferase family 2 protein [Alphaproteobacteria bacterium]|nr:glycosyltransferase family 2 protein [Alphaproteobacteria bacterium]